MNNDDLIKWLQNRHDEADAQGLYVIAAEYKEAIAALSPVLPDEIEGITKSLRHAAEVSRDCAVSVGYQIPEGETPEEEAADLIERLARENEENAEWYESQRNCAIALASKQIKSLQARNNQAHELISNIELNLRPSELTIPQMEYKIKTTYNLCHSFLKSVQERE